MRSPQTVFEYQRARAWLYFIFYAGLIVFLSNQPGNPNIPLPFPHFDKLVHLVEYFVFATFLERALSYTIRGRTTWPTVIITALFAASDEVHQYFIPYRSMDIMDWLTDMVACGMATASFRYLHPGLWRRNEVEQTLDGKNS